MPKVFFATDLHGSEVCWKKFLNAAKFYDADVLICGGDMTGKAIVPIVSENGHYTVTLGGEHQAVAADQVTEVEAIRRAEIVELGEGRVVDVDGFSMISTGWSNPTPWNTHREESEEKLTERIESM